VSAITIAATGKLAELGGSGIRPIASVHPSSFWYVQRNRAVFHSFLFLTLCPEFRLSDDPEILSSFSSLLQVS
jgi:hypothetical protein